MIASGEWFQKKLFLYQKKCAVFSLAKQAKTHAALEYLDMFKVNCCGFGYFGYVT